MEKMKECRCKNYQTNIKVLDSALITYFQRYRISMTKSFDYCPYCGKLLRFVESELGEEKP